MYHIFMKPLHENHYAQLTNKFQIQENITNIDIILNNNIRLLIISSALYYIQYYIFQIDDTKNSNSLLYNI